MNMKNLIFAVLLLSFGYSHSQGVQVGHNNQNSTIVEQEWDSQ